MKKIFQIFILLIILISCNNPEGENFIPETPSMEGDFTMISISINIDTKSETSTNRIVNECVQKSTFNIKKDNTFNFTEYIKDNSGKCLKLEEKFGKLENILAFYGNPYGKVKFNNNQIFEFTSNNTNGTVTRLLLINSVENKTSIDTLRTTTTYTFRRTY